MFGGGLPESSENFRGLTRFRAAFRGCILASPPFARMTRLPPENTFLRGPRVDIGHHVEQGCRVDIIFDAVMLNALVASNERNWQPCRNATVARSTKSSTSRNTNTTLYHPPPAKAGRDALPVLRSSGHVAAHYGAIASSLRVRRSILVGSILNRSRRRWMPSTTTCLRALRVRIRLVERRRPGDGRVPTRRVQQDRGGWPS